MRYITPKNVRRRRRFKRNLIFLIIIAAMIVFTYNILTHLSLIDFQSSGYTIIKEDENPNYSGKGQEAARNKDGYFTTFTTSSDYPKTYKDYKQNGNAPWSDSEYWDGTMSDNGCGITAIATILSGYDQDYTPENLREKYFPLLDNDKISQELSGTFKIKNSDFYYDDVHLSEESITKHLMSGRPVLICVWDKPHQNRWTGASHYMVLLAADGVGKVYVANPNGGKNAYNSSGWYDSGEILPFVAKALYIESYE